jgi:hypothetical protein
MRRFMRGWVAGALQLLAAAAARPAGAMTPVTIPARLVVENRSFDASPAGFRRYLETIRWTNPELYWQLSPDVSRLESRALLPARLAIPSFGVAAAATLVTIFLSKDCRRPPVTDPNLSADSAAWQACNHYNLVRLSAVGLPGFAIGLAGVVTTFAINPSRDDIRDLVNRHNRISPRKMQLQIGYEPVRQAASAGVNLSF